MRLVFAVLMTAAIIFFPLVLSPTAARAAANGVDTPDRTAPDTAAPRKPTRKNNHIFGLSTAQLAIGTAIVVTGARVAVALAIGGPLIGPSLGSGLLAIYVGHVIAEGLVVGLGAGAGTYAVSALSDLNAESRPTILPQRLEDKASPSGHLPLEMPPPDDD
jgi:hypothetical protein